MELLDLQDTLAEQQSKLSFVTDTLRQSAAGGAISFSHEGQNGLFHILSGIGAALGRVCDGLDEYKSINTGVKA